MLCVGGGSYGSVLNLAVIKSEPWLVSAIIKAGTDVNMKDNEGNSCLHHLMAVYRKHKHRNALIAELIIEAGAKLNMYNNEKWAPVHIAARKGQTSAFRFIVNINAKLQSKNLETFDLNLLGGSRGWSPLHIASHSGHYKTVEALISAGAAVFIKNFDGKTPKDTSKGDLAIYKYLSRIEKANIQMVIQDNSKNIPHEIPQKSEINEINYKQLYEYYKNNDTTAIEHVLQTNKCIAIKADAVYLLSQLKQRKAARFLLITVNSENTLVKYEATLALESIKRLENKTNPSHNLIGPRLPKTSPLQMSLPTNMSEFLDEDERIDTLLLI